MKEQKKHNQLYAPTINEMQSWYEDDLRIGALKSLEYENNKTEAKGSFFNAFRKFEKQECEIFSDSYKDNVYYEKYKTYVEEKTISMGKKIQEIENLIEYEKFFLRFERKMSSETNNCGNYGSNPATRYRVDRIKNLEKELEIVLENSPEAWEFYYNRQLIRDI